MDQVIQFHKRRVTCNKCGFQWIVIGDDEFHVEAYHNKDTAEALEHDCSNAGINDVNITIRQR